MYRECTFHVNVADVSRNGRLRTKVICYWNTHLIFNNNVKEVAGPAIAVSASEAAKSRIHQEVKYSEKPKNNTEITQSFSSLSYTTVYLFCL